MAAPKAKRRGRPVSTYMNPARLDKLATVADSPVKAIYLLVDQLPVPNGLKEKRPASHKGV